MVAIIVVSHSLCSESIANQITVIGFYMQPCWFAEILTVVKFKGLIAIAICVEEEAEHFH